MQSAKPSTPLEPASVAKRGAALSAFDRTVLLVIGGALLLLVVVLLRGDRVGLGVIALSPPADAQRVAVRSPIAVKFDARLDLEHPIETAIRVSGTEGQVERVDDELHFTPSAALAPGSRYTVTIEAGLLAENGRALLEPLTWSFETGVASIVYGDVDAEGYTQLYRVVPQAADSSAPPASGELLAASPFGVWDFAVASEGDRVVYSGLTAAGGADLYSVTPGSEPSLLYPCPQAACSTPALAPQGTLLAFNKRNMSDLAAALVSPPRLWLLDIDTGEAAPLFDDSQRLASDPRWSSDSNWLTWIAPNEAGIGVMDLETGEENFFPSGTGEPAPWRPDEAQFVMSMMGQVGPLAVTHLFLTDPVSGEQVNLSGIDAPVQDNGPAWSPDGAWIAFRRKYLEGDLSTPGQQIWLMRADGSEASALTQDAAYYHGSPSWSPDGTTLTFHRSPLRGPNIVIEVMAADVRSGKLWTVASPGQWPQWIP